MAAYLEIVKVELVQFSKYEIKYIDREEKINVDGLAKLATNRYTELLYLVLVEIIPKLSIMKRDIVGVLSEESLIN